MPLLLCITALYITCSLTLLELKGVLSCSLTLLCFSPDSLWHAWKSALQGQILQPSLHTQHAKYQHTAPSQACLWLLPFSMPCLPWSPKVPEQEVLTNIPNACLLPLTALLCPSAPFLQTLPFPVMLLVAMSLPGEGHPARCQHCTPAGTDTAQGKASAAFWAAHLPSPAHTSLLLPHPLPDQGGHSVMSWEKMHLHRWNAWRASVVNALQLLTRTDTGTRGTEVHQWERCVCHLPTELPRAGRITSAQVIPLERRVTCCFWNGRYARGTWQLNPKGRLQCRKKPELYFEVSNPVLWSI